MRKLKKIFSPAMEDAHTTILSLDDLSASHTTPSGDKVTDKPPSAAINRAFFAVFDGHGGKYRFLRSFLR
jgi:serine/threonine protein phosphatase PrpC